MTKVNLKKNEQGFSFVELSAVLAITAIMAAFSLPMLSSSMRDMQLASDAKSIATTMTYAKMSATSKMTRYRLSFNLAHNQWNLAKFNRSNLSFELQQAINGLSNGIAHSGIAFKSNSSSSPSGFPHTSSSTITFNSRGIPVEGISIVYISNADADYAVSTSLSGKVQVWRYQNNQWIPQ
jgi:prepilin-type N-terminal cleavage/methylation domain-containing protein